MSFLHFLRDVAHAVWERATDHTRRPVCGTCGCVHRDAR